MKPIYDWGMWLLLSLCLTSCMTPDTQPVINGALEWKRAEDEELVRHRQLASVSKFSDDPVANATAKAQYTAALDHHQRLTDQLAASIISWAQRVGQFDQAYADQTLDKMIDLYIRAKAIVDPDTGERRQQ